MTEDRSQDPSKEVARTPRCPLCGKPRVQRYRPFCSARCRDVDLGLWFNDAYAVPAVEPGYDEDQEEE